MAASVANILKDARAQEIDPKLALLYGLSTEAVIKAAYVLSVSVSLMPDELRSIVTKLWPDAAEEPTMSPGQDFVNELGQWPVIHKARDGWRITEPIAVKLARDFISEEPEKFVRVHEQLVDLEESRNALDSDDEWFIQGRIAYYLAGLSPEASVEKFGHVFAEPPIMDRVACRLWLSDLALRQEALLEVHEREVAFFKGFRLYMSSPNRTDALPFFRLVYQDEIGDVYSAIALHLAGVIEKRKNVVRAIDLFSKSISMSEKLNLQENELMARHSLIWALIQRGQEDLYDYGKASDLAEENLERAISYKDPLIEVWCARTATMTRWISRGTQDPKDSSFDELAKELAETLMQLEVKAIALGDFETGLLSANDAAKILRDVGDLDGALTYIEKAIGDTSYIVGYLAALRRIGQTVGSIRKMTKDPVRLQRTRQILQRIRGTGL